MCAVHVLYNILNCVQSVYSVTDHWPDTRTTQLLT